MRDIRRDLQERLANLASEKNGLQRRLKQLEERENMVANLLKQEELIWKTQQPSLFASESTSPQMGRSQLGKFLLSILQDGNSRSLNDLLELAESEGVVANSRYPRRAVNFALVGMKQHGMVERVSSGVWKISNKSKGGEANSQAE